MSLAANSFKVNEFTIQTIDGSITVDLGGSGAILMLDYFEDILSPCITMSVLLNSTTSLTNILPIRGGEKVSLSISTLFGDFNFRGDNSLYVYKQGARSANAMSESFSLHLVSRETITNETTRCKARYNGKISDSVDKILKEVLNVGRSKLKEGNIQPTANTYSFIGNLKKPFSTIAWLCSKSLPTQNSRKTKEGDKENVTKGVSGFLFYENSEGFNFKSIESLVSKTNLGTADNKDVFKYYYDQIIEENNPQNNFKILNYSVEKNSDLIKSLRSGMYSNVTYFYNLFTQKLSVYKYTLKDEIKNASKLGTNDRIAVSDELGSSISRILFRTSDIGVLDDDFTTTTFDEGQQRDIADMAKSISRYNILFTQALNMIVPCNVQLKVGDIIYVNFPKIQNSNLKTSDEEQSGYYLIKELRHHIELGTLTTSLKLIRDSYGLYGADR